MSSRAERSSPSAGWFDACSDSHVGAISHETCKRTRPGPSHPAGSSHSAALPLLAGELAADCPPPDLRQPIARDVRLKGRDQVVDVPHPSLVQGLAYAAARAVRGTRARAGKGGKGAAREQCESDWGPAASRPMQAASSTCVPVRRAAAQPGGGEPGLALRNWSNQAKLLSSKLSWGRRTRPSRERIRNGCGREGRVGHGGAWKVEGVVDCVGGCAYGVGAPAADRRATRRCASGGSQPSSPTASRQAPRRPKSTSPTPESRGRSSLRSVHARSAHARSAHARSATATATVAGMMAVAPTLMATATAKGRRVARIAG